MKKVLRNILFWQPSFDFLGFLNTKSYGSYLLVILNYSIWVFLFFISYRLVKYDTNIFWQLLFATIVGELVEKWGKRKRLWLRPMFNRRQDTPSGLVDSWYKTGSFPSGHTIKAVYFFLFLLQYQIFGRLNYALIVVPLIIFRVIAGFHYPIDILGGSIIGVIIWFAFSWITMPGFLNDIIRIIFNFVFFIE